MNRLLLISALSVLLSGSLLAQGIVRPKPQREAILEAAASILTPDSMGLQEAIGELENPFVTWVDPSLKGKSESAAPAAPAERLSDAAALDIIGTSFRPSGSMIGAGTAFLNLSAGRRVELGETFATVVRGETYEVRVESITMRGYTLRLGSATMTREFLQDRMGTGSITRPPIPEADVPEP